MSELEVGFIETSARPWLKTAVATYIPGALYTWHWGDGSTTWDESNIAQHVYHVAPGRTFTFDVRVDVLFPVEKLPDSQKRPFWRRER